MSPLTEDRILSETSVGFPESSLIRGDILRNVDVSSAYREILSDVYCIAVICKKHQRIALQRQLESNFYYLPYKEIATETVSFEETSQDLLKNTILQSKERKYEVLWNKLVDIRRVEQPKTKQYVTRYTSAIIVNPSKKSKCCFENEAIYWMDFARITELLKASQTVEINLLGNEYFRFFDKHINCIFREISIEDKLQFLGDNTMESSLFRTLDYQKNDLEILLNEFIVQCYPSETMSFASFCPFCLKIWPEFIENPPEIGMLFNCFNLNGSSALTFQDIVLGFSFIDENALDILQNHPSKQLLEWFYDKRISYIFRYYDLNQNGYLDKDELSHLINDYVKDLTENGFQVPKSFKSEQDKHNWVTALLQQFGEQSPNEHKLSIVGFHDAIKQGPVEKFSLEPTENFDIMKVVLRGQIDLKVTAAKFDFNRIPDRSKYLSFCNQDFRSCQICTNRKMVLSDHFLRLSDVGEVVDITRLEALSSESLLNFSEDIPETDIFILANDVMLRISRFGVTLFEETMEELDETAQFWFFENKETMMNVIREIVSKAKEIFSAEKRVVQVTSPALVFGDLHGNLKDLLTFAHHFWRCAPFFTGSKYLFLGDYVDRGNFGIEVIILLFCLKILAPANFILVRGNHEIREMQEQFTFYLECRTRLSVELWQLINDCFDVMPIVAIIDERFFCAHGGIPVSVKSYEPLSFIPCPLNNPIQIPEAWEVMWNDPMEDHYLACFPQEERNLMISRGFVSNIKRGTGYIFGHKLVSAFCELNSIDFVIRAHEVFPTGIRFFCRGQVVSIFSCSNYVGLSNSAAALQIKRNKLRVIHVEKDETEPPSRNS